MFGGDSCGPQWIAVPFGPREAISVAKRCEYYLVKGKAERNRPSEKVHDEISTRVAAVKK
jgi:hypothetical protein